MPERPTRKARRREPVREQAVIPYELPESTLAPSHAARVLWRVLETLDLGEFERSVKGVEGKAGHPTHAPRMLLCLWRYGQDACASERACAVVSPGGVAGLSVGSRRGCT